MALLVELLTTRAKEVADEASQAHLHQQCQHVLQQLQTADPLRSQYWTLLQQQHSAEQVTAV